MGKAPCCDKDNVKRGPWSPEEDETLKTYIQQHGTGGNWIAFPKKAGLRRCGKSCRLRWLNYLRPDIRHGGFSEEEDIIIYTLYNQMGSRWSIIASQLHGRTDNDVKNHWNTKLKKKLSTTKNNNVMMVNNNNLNENPTFLGHSDTYTNIGFSSLLNEDLQASTTILTNFNYGHAQNYVNNPTNYSGLVLTDSQQFNTANETKNQSVSTSQEDSNTISSSFSMGNLDEQNVSWTNNTNGGDYGSFMMDFGLGFSNEFVNGFWSSLEKGTREESVTNLVSNLGDYELYGGDIKPQGLLQSVINQ